MMFDEHCGLAKHNQVAGIIIARFASEITRYSSDVFEYYLAAVLSRAYLDQVGLNIEHGEGA